MLRDLHYNFGTKLLNTIDPELAHKLAISFLKYFYLSKSTLPDSNILKTKISDLEIMNPIGLAAGFDKNAEIFNPAISLGFGFTEVGTITPEPQYGNKRPRLFRISEELALINRMGFNNIGMKKIRANLSMEKKGVVGINIGANAKSINKILDYSKVFEFLASYFDYVTINVSSPNTENLRDLQKPENLEKILVNIQSLNLQLKKRLPIFIKLSPDLSFRNIEEILNAGENCAVSGIIATNTTTSRESLAEEYTSVRGGLSGKPLLQKSNKILEHIAKEKKKKTILIGTGGIFSANDLYEKIKLGASAVQIYTSFIYQGPRLLTKLKKDLESLILADGYKNLNEAIGSSLKTKRES